MRDKDGIAIAVVDISIGEIKVMPTHEMNEVQKMLRLLAVAHREVADEVARGRKNIVLGRSLFEGWVERFTRPLFARSCASSALYVCLCEVDCINGISFSFVAEVEQNDDLRIEIMFDRLMLTDLRDNVSRLDARFDSFLRSPCSAYFKIHPCALQRGTSFLGLDRSLILLYAQ